MKMLLSLGSSLKNSPSPRTPLFLSLCLGGGGRRFTNWDQSTAVIRFLSTTATLHRRSRSGGRPASTALLLSFLAGRGRAPPHSRSPRPSPRLCLPLPPLSPAAPVLSQMPARARRPKEEGLRRPRRRPSKGASEVCREQSRSVMGIDSFLSLHIFRLRFSRAEGEGKRLACSLLPGLAPLPLCALNGKQQQQKAKHHGAVWRRSLDDVCGLVVVGVECRGD